MANVSLQALNNMSSDQIREHSCFKHSSYYMAWRETYLTENTRKNLVATTSVNFISAILTIILNALVITAVVTRQQLRSNSNILLACLAGTDLMVGALVQPLIIASDIYHILGVGPYCDFDNARLIFLSIVWWASFNSLTVVSIERYVAIKHALRYKEIVTKRRLIIAVLLAWVASVVETTPLIFLETTDNQEHWSYLIYIDMTMGAIMLVNSSAIIYTNTFIFSEARRLDKRLQTEQIPEEEAKKLKKENKAATTVTIMLVALVISYFPVMIVFGLATILRKGVESLDLYIIGTWCMTFAMLGSFFNPVIYCWRLTKFRNAFFELLHLRQAQNNPNAAIIEIPLQQVQPVIQSSVCVGQEPVLLSFSALQPSNPCTVE